LTTFYSPTVNPDIHAYQDNGDCSTINRDHYSDYTAYDHHNNTNPHYIIHTQVHYHHEQAHDNIRYLYRCFPSFCCSHIINNLSCMLTLQKQQLRSSPPSPLFAA
jgi:hypothetical protein